MLRGAMLAVAALLLVSCAPGRASQAAPEAGPAPSFPVMAGLPPLPPYADLAAPRQAASLHTAPGTALSGTQYAAASGDFAVFEQGLRLTPAGRGQAISYALYSLPATGLANEVVSAAADLGVDSQSRGSSAIQPAFQWVGISDYAAGRWRWRQEANWSLPITSANLAASGTVHLLIVPLDAPLEIYSVERTGSDPRAATPDQDAALTVGPGREYPSLEAAYAAVPPAGGATIMVYPAESGRYQQPALLVDKPNVRFWGVPASGSRVKLNGDGYNYTGAGSVPRAIFQFNPGADGCTVQGFELYNARNDSYNGAAVRINQANHVQVLDCEIHTCDMGIMSNGDATAVPPTALDQVIEGCIVHGNGSNDDPGYNHNLYLGGTSVTLRGCEVYGSVTGHNVKSRAHFNRFEFCYVHDSANREFDLVDDAANTAMPGSDSILLGCIIAKAPDCPGNRNVIHFGQDGGGDHTGRLYVQHCTIATPFVSPVVLLSAPGAAASFGGNVIWDQASGQANQVVIAIAGGASLALVTGSRNWLSSGFQVPAPQFDPALTWFGAAGVDPPFADAAQGDYHLTAALANLTDSGAAWPAAALPLTPGHTAATDLLPAQYGSGAGVETRSTLLAPDLGAYEYMP